MGKQLRIPANPNRAIQAQWKLMPVLILLALFSHKPPVARAAYMGPDRHRVEEECHDECVLNRCYYQGTQTSSGSYTCTIYLDTAQSCPANPAADQWSVSRCGWPSGVSGADTVTNSWVECQQTEEVCQDVPVDYPPAVLNIEENCSEPGMNNWCLSGLSFQFSAVEPVPGYQITVVEGDQGALCTINAPAGNCTWSPPGNGIYTQDAWAHSTWGDSTERNSLSGQLDGDPPQLTLALPPADGLNGWYQAPVPVGLNANDADSGLASSRIGLNGIWYGTSLIIDTEGNHTLEFQATDLAGNQNTQSSIVKLDSIAPEIFPVIPAPDGENNWYLGSLALSVSGTDQNSGINNEQLKVDGVWGTASDVISGDGLHVVEFWVTDLAGNQTGHSHELGIDTGAPVLDYSISPIDGQNGWYQTPPELEMTCSDITSGLAGQWINWDAGQFADSTTIDQDGIFSVQLETRDNAGHLTASTIQVQVDQTAPGLDIILAGPEGQNDWYQGPVLVSFAAEDLVSGLDSSHLLWEGDAYSSPVLLNEEGIHNIWVEAVDLAGNQNQQNPDIKIDSQPPELETRMEILDRGKRIVDLQADCIDGHSGCDRVQVQIDGGDWLDLGVYTIAPGGSNITWMAVDFAGNETFSSESIQLDTSAPEIILEAPDTCSGITVFAGTIGEESGITSASLWLNGFRLTLDPEVGAFSKALILPDGYHELQVEAVDLSGNKGVSNQVELYVDNQAPVISLPTGLNLYTGKGLVIEDNRELYVVEYEFSSAGQVFLSGTVPENLENPILGNLQTALEDFPGEIISLKIVAIDTCGNLAEEYFEIEIPRQDTSTQNTPPTATRTPAETPSYLQITATAYSHTPVLPSTTPGSASSEHRICGKSDQFTLAEGEITYQGINHAIWQELVLDPDTGTGWLEIILLEDRVVRIRKVDGCQPVNLAVFNGKIETVFKGEGVDPLLIQFSGLELGLTAQSEIICSAMMPQPFDFARGLYDPETGEIIVLCLNPVQTHWGCWIALMVVILILLILLCPFKGQLVQIRAASILVEQGSEEKEFFFHRQLEQRILGFRGKVVYGIAIRSESRILWIWVKNKHSRDS